MFLNNLDVLFMYDVVMIMISYSEISNNFDLHFYTDEESDSDKEGLLVYC